MEEYFDFKTAMEYVGYFHIFKNLQQKFITEYKGFPDTLIKKARKGKKQDVRLMIHSLKGITKNLGANALFDASVKAEYNLEKNIDDPLDEYINVFRKTYEEIKSFKM